MSSARLRVPYRQRILHYCEVNGVAVPKNFDAPKSSDRYALVDITSQPPTLVSRTSYLKNEVHEFLSRPENRERKFKLLDFKRGLELSCSIEGKFEKIGSFDHVSPGEVLHLVSPWPFLSGNRYDGEDG
ncbi:MAG: hypothetical protein LBE85_04500 [Candidatus Accumulibacter sp.]|jgi:hypothetical protein|nr:hypothetical protein [Accumulibacter sp.]